MIKVIKRHALAQNSDVEMAAAATEMHMKYTSNLERVAAGRDDL